MKQLYFLLLLCCLSGCETIHVAGHHQRFRPRVTFYSPHEDRFGSRIAIGGRAHEGRTMAAPSALPFHQHVNVPGLKGVVGNGHFEIQDRGTALEQAYQHGQLRLDIYVASRAKLNRLKRNQPEYMEATFE